MDLFFFFFWCGLILKSHAISLLLYFKIFRPLFLPGSADVKISLDFWCTSYNFAEYLLYCVSV